MPAHPHLVEQLVRETLERLRDGLPIPSSGVCPQEPERLVFQDLRPLSSGGQGMVLISDTRHIRPWAKSDTLIHTIIKVPHIRRSTDCAALTILPEDNATLLEESKTYREIGPAPHLAPEPLELTFDLEQVRLPSSDQPLVWTPDSDRHITLLATPLPTTSLDQHGTLAPTTLDDALRYESRRGDSAARPTPTHQRAIYNWFEFARALALALHAIHRAGHSHSDIKPANVVLQVTEGWWREITVIDLGAADGRGCTISYLPSDLLWRLVDRVGAGEGVGAMVAGESLAVHQRRDLHAFGLILARLLLRSAEIERAPQGSDLQDRCAGWARRNDSIERAVAYLRAEHSARGPLLDVCHRFLLGPPEGASAPRLLMEFYRELEVLMTHLRDDALGRRHLHAATTGSVSLRESLHSIVNEFDVVKILDRSDGYCAVPASLASVDVTGPQGLTADVGEELSVDHVFEVLRSGRGWHAKRLLHLLLRRVVHGRVSVSVDDFIRGLRLYCGVLAIRDREFDAVIALDAELRAWVASAPALRDDPEARQQIEWWSDLLTTKARYHQAPVGFVPPTLARTPDDPRARLWRVSVEVLYDLQHAKVTEESIDSLHFVISTSFSSVELLFGTLTLARSQIVARMHWSRVLSTFTMAASQARNHELPHEYAATLVLIAKWVVGLSATSGPAPEIDHPRCLALAAEAALVAAELYRRLQAMEGAIRATKLAAECYSHSLIREHIIEGFRVVHRAVNMARIEDTERPSPRWVHQTLERLDRNWNGLTLPGEGTQVNSDAGSFLALRLYGRYGANIMDLLVETPEGMPPGDELPPDDALPQDGEPPPGPASAPGDEPSEGPRAASRENFGNPPIASDEPTPGLLAMSDEPTQAPLGSGFDDSTVPIESPPPLAPAVAPSQAGAGAGLGRGRVSLGLPSVDDALTAAVRDLGRSGDSASDHELGYLDVGVGTGRDLEAVCKMRVFGLLLGVDILALRTAATIEAQGGVAPRVIRGCVTRLADLLRHKVGEVALDLVLVRDVLAHVACKRDAIRNVAAVTRPGGRVILSDPVQRTLMVPGEWDELMDSCFFPGLETEAGYAEMLAAEGFEIEETRSLDAEARSVIDRAHAVHRRRHGDDASAHRMTRIWSRLKLSLDQGTLGWAMIVARRSAGPKASGPSRS